MINLHTQSYSNHWVPSRSQLNKAEKSTNKLEKLCKQWESEKSISSIKEKDKMTLDEFALLLSCYKKEKKTFQNNHKLHEKITDIFGQFLQLFNQELEQSTFVQSGDLLIYNTKKWAALKNKKLSREEKFKNTLITPFGHAVVAIVDTKAKDNKLQGVDVLQTYRTIDLTATNFAISDVWRLDITKLLRKDTKQFSRLQKICTEKNKNLDQLVQKKYQKAHQNIQENLKKCAKEMIENEQRRRYESGLADFHLADKGGHKRKTPRKDLFHKIHQKFTQGFLHKEQMICSEFALKSIIAALIETDITLQKYAGISNQSSSQELLFLNIPINARERLKYVHTGRLVDLLQKAGCLQKLKTPKIQKTFFQEK